MLKSFLSKKINKEKIENNKAEKHNQDKKRILSDFLGIQLKRWDMNKIAILNLIKIKQVKKEFLQNK